MPLPAVEVADIFRRYGPAYRQAHDLPWPQHRLMQAIETCRTPALGGSVEWCDHCQYTHIVYRSCRNRHCPKCQGLARAKWLQQREAELLPVEYFHVVFTLPAALAAIAFYNGSFEYIPIPDKFRGKGTDKRTYGNIRGRDGRTLVDYFPDGRRERLSEQSVHVDPEFETFTYGDPTPPKASLSQLSEGSLLVFYAGLKGWKFDCPPALYIIGCFEVARAGLATSFSQAELAGMFQNNFHVMHRDVFEDQKDRLVLVRGSAKSRLLKKAVKISSVGTDKNGRPLHRLAPEMQAVFGGFEGNTSIQRSPPRWVAPEFTQHAAKFISALR